MKFFVNRTGWHYMVKDKYLYCLSIVARRVDDNECDYHYVDSLELSHDKIMTEEDANNDPSYYAYEADTLEEAYQVKHPNQISHEEWMKMLGDVCDLCNEYCDDKPIKDNTPIWKEDF